MVNRIGAEVQGLTYDGLNTLYLCVLIKCKKEESLNKRIYMSIFVFFETDRLTGTSDVWYENRE